MNGAQAMTDPIDRLLEEDSVALHYRQKLKPMDEGDLSLFPPTYPVSRETKQHRHGTPYTVNVPGEGTKAATPDPVRFKTVVLDSIQSQANRMEATFTREFAHTVPRIGVRAGAKTAMVTELSHRIADAAIRATDLEEEIRAAFEHHDAGDSVLLARLCPTALVYGAWDSRDTRVKIPRLIRCEIVAHDAEVSTRSAQFSGTFSREQLGMTETQWKKGAEVGFAPTPSVDQHGGVSVKGSIVQSAQIHLGAVRHLGDDNDGVLCPLRTRPRPGRAAVRRTRVQPAIGVLAGPRRCTAGVARAAHGRAGSGRSGPRRDRWVPGIGRGRGEREAGDPG